MQIFLNRRAVASLDLTGGDRLRLTTADGAAWVTIEGSPDDSILTSSSSLEFAGPGRLVIEALESDMIVQAGSLQKRIHEPLLLVTH
ncbi:MAG: DUF2917 domain-containing protein [Verrucomicrobiaceae bacterium]|nr:MAG: DUF2917 domain-containing protein [Verrucomicrobiaceae bacterium]